MKTTMITSLFLSTALVAQSNMADPDRSRKTQPVDTGVTTQPVDTGVTTQPVDSGVDTQPLDDSLKGRDVYQVAGKKSSGYIRNQLHLLIEGHDFRIRGGEAGEACAILVGLELKAIPLPGGEELSVEPLAVVAHGHFDESGEFGLMIGYDAKMIPRLTYHLQAVAIDGMSGKFWTSNVETLDFSEGSTAGMREPRKGDGDGDGDDDSDDADADADNDDGDDGSSDSDNRMVAGNTSATKADTAGLDNTAGTHN